MASRRFSSWAKIPLIVGLGFLGLPLPGCGDDATADCPAGSVPRDGKCFANCDEAIDCKGNPALKCVVASSAKAEGQCAATCTAPTDCQAGQACAPKTSMKSEAVQVCLDRGVLGLKPGKTGDACASDTECDGAGGLACAAGKCGVAPGKAGDACGARPCGDGLACFQGKCAAALGGAGEGCDDTRGCDDAAGLVCLDGICQTSIAGPGEPCGEARPCNGDDGLVCADGSCRYGCKSFSGCAQGYECKGLPAGTSDVFAGACVKSTFESADGQYGTNCPKPESCDKDSDFFCVGAKGDANAFCSKKNGCTTDDECPSGYWCGAVTSADSKGIIDFENPIKACLQRDFCAPCSSDLDCSNYTGSICVPDVDGEKFCSVPCNPSKNSCAIGAGCVDVGEGVFACRPDVGVCHPKEGQPAGCEPCRIDGDCGPGALCRSGAIGNKAGLKWCQTPCGAPDADGKRPCPVSPSGAEMVCLDENQFGLGGPFQADDPQFGNSVYGFCFKPLTVDNTVSTTKDPAVNACGNGKREGDEECDDGNSNSSDGCNKCKISDTCRFTLAEENGAQVLKQGSDTLTEIPSPCLSFAVEGTLKNPGDVAQFRFEIPDGFYSWFEVFSGKAGSCSADLVASVHQGVYDDKTDTLDITDKDGKITACDKLNSSIKNLDADNPSLCKEGNFLGCGSCTDKGLCGTCDDDNGIGNCPRMLLAVTTSYQQYEVKFASNKQLARIYAHDPKATNVSFTAVVDRLTPGAQGPKNSPGLSCF